MSKKTKSLIGKLYKGAIAGGIAYVGMAFADGGYTVSSLSEFIEVGKMISSAFATGAVLAVWKMMTWKA